AIAVEPLPMAPPRMPYYAGDTYFQLDRSGDLWKQLNVTKAIALHIAGDFPGLQLKPWALKPLASPDFHHAPTSLPRPAGHAAAAGRFGSHDHDSQARRPPRGGASTDGGARCDARRGRGGG